MEYVASVDRSSFPAHVHATFTNKAKAIAWAKKQGGYNAQVYKKTGWMPVWISK